MHTCSLMAPIRTMSVSGAFRSNAFLLRHRSVETASADIGDVGLQATKFRYASLQLALAEGPSINN